MLIFQKAHARRWFGPRGAGILPAIFEFQKIASRRRDAGATFLRVADDIASKN
jgi:hypothetical protein